jgi:N-acyl-D-aspartate/D-glutamate deacylase
MSLDSLKAGIDWGFETFPEYMDLIERKGCAMNLAAFVGHSTLRTHVMGSQASDRIATADEIQAMRTLLGIRRISIGLRGMGVREEMLGVNHKSGYMPAL